MDTKVIFEAIVGSQSYGTATPSSDEDRKFVYIQNPNEILGFKYQQQQEINKDYVGYEIRRFVELLMTANPSVLELIYSPEDCIIHKDPVFDLLIENRNLFLTKQCKNSFGGFAVQQIKKSKGHNKKMNWEEKQIERKQVLDFCYVVDGGKTKNIKTWLDEIGFTQSHCGLVKLNNMPFCYAVYLGKNYKGICSPNGNDVLLTSIPKGETPAITMYFNKDAYSIHCKEYKEYQDWLKNRNMARFVDVVNHGQKIDGKNLLHSRRLVDMALEIAQTGTINVRRPNADYLLQIRRGEIPLEQIITDAEADLEKLDLAYEKCNLPESVDPEFAHNLLIKIRKSFKHDWSIS